MTTGSCALLCKTQTPVVLVLWLFEKCYHKGEFNMYRVISAFIAAVILVFVFSGSSLATTMLWFDPDMKRYGVGDTLTIDLYADIDEVDAIFGFGFDLSFDGGSSYVAGPGESGPYLTFGGFAANTTVFNDPFPPLWDDGDTIAGAVDPLSDDVWGTSILLGTFSFVAPITGPIGAESIYIGPAAGDYGIFGEEGLLGFSALMPNNPTAEIVAVPEPAALTLLLVAFGLAGLAGLRHGKLVLRDNDKGQEHD